MWPLHIHWPWLTQERRDDICYVRDTHGYAKPLLGSGESYELENVNMFGTFLH